MATPKSGKKSGKKKAAGKKKEKKGDKTSSGDRAGLIFPVGRIGSMLRKGGFSRRVGAGAQVYLAATLEYLTAELVELSAKAAGKGKRVNPRAVTLAVRHDNDLGSLLKDVTLARGGVVSSIHEALLKKKKKEIFCFQPKKIFFSWTKKTLLGSLRPKRTKTLKHLMCF